MSTLKHPSVPVIALIFSSCLWGLSWIPLKSLGALGFQGVFLVLSGQLILCVLFVKSGFKLSFFKSHTWYLIGIFFAGGAAILCFTYALIYGDVIRVMVLFYLLPIWGVLGGHIFLGESIDRVRWLGVVSALVGAFFILGGPQIFSSPPTWLDVIAFLSGLFFAINNLFFRGLDAVPLPTKLFTMFSGCTTICLITLTLSSETLPVDVPIYNYFWLVFYALTWLLVANVLSQWAVTQMEAGRSSVILIFELFAAVVSAIIIGGESIETYEVIGGVLVIFAALLEALRSPLVDERSDLSGASVSSR